MRLTCHDGVPNDERVEADGAATPRAAAGMAGNLWGRGEVGA